MARRPSTAAVRIRAEVFHLVGLIPPGQFTTYGALALHMNVAPLFVASVLARLSDEESAVLPGHRVVAAGPRISPAMDPELRREQQGRLEGEGLRFDAKGLICEADAHFHRVGVRREVRWSKAPPESGAGDGRSQMGDGALLPGCRRGHPRETDPSPCRSTVCCSRSPPWPFWPVWCRPCVP